MKKKDFRKRTRCKQCKQRVNLVYKTKDGKIILTCPKCLSQGEFKITKRI